MDTDTILIVGYCLIQNREDVTMLSPLDYLFAGLDAQTLIPTHDETKRPTFGYRVITDVLGTARIFGAQNRP